MRPAIDNAPRFAGDDSRALAGASAVSATFGALWLLLVWFGPRRSELPRLLGDPEPEQVTVMVVEELPPPAPVATPAPPRPVEPPAIPKIVPTPDEPTRAARPAAAARAAPTVSTPAPATDPGAAFGGAFAGANPGPRAADVRGVLRGVRVSGAAESAPTGKSSLGSADDALSRTPGRGRTAAGDGAAIGTVAAPLPGVARAAVRVSAPRPIGESAGTVRGDGAQLGTAVRGRESQLRFCYVESGLRADPTLAGSVTLSMSLDAGGAVTAAEVIGRGWSGPGATAAEACILTKVRGWRLPAQSAGGTYEFSFSFTR